MIILYRCDYGLNITTLKKDSTMNWDDDDFEVPFTAPAKAPPAVAKRTADAVAQEAAELRLISDLVGADGAVVTPVVPSTVVEPAALRAYGQSVCHNLHTASVDKIPRRHLLEFYRAVVDDAGRTLGSVELQSLITSLTISQQAAVRAAAAPKGKPKKAVGPKVWIGNAMDTD